MSSFLLGKGLLNRPGERLLHTQRVFKILAEYAVHYIGRAISQADKSSGFDDRLKIILPSEHSVEGPFPSERNITTRSAAEFYCPFVSPSNLYSPEFHGNREK